MNVLENVVDDAKFKLSSHCKMKIPELVQTPPIFESYKLVKSSLLF